jgi:hypothetical protein
MIKNIVNATDDHFAGMGMDSGVPFDDKNPPLFAEIEIGPLKGSVWVAKGHVEVHLKDGGFQCNYDSENPDLNETELRVIHDEEDTDEPTTPQTVEEARRFLDFLNLCESERDLEMLGLFVVGTV